MLRAGPFSDERIIGLANRRFIPFFFDLNSSGDAGDADAREFVIKVRPDLKGGSVSTPPVLFMTSEGLVVGEVDNYAPADDMLAAMLKVLAEHPEFAKPSEAELKIEAPLEKASLLFDLQRYDESAAALKDVKDARARYLLGRIARFRKDWDAMEGAFKEVTDAEFIDDVRMERAYPLWERGAFRELRDHLHGFPASSARASEARYYEGLACFHLGAKDEALKRWEEAIRKGAQDRWIYRADWAWTQVKGGKSLLGRIGYMGVKNPDLLRRAR